MLGLLWLSVPSPSPSSEGSTGNGLSPDTVLGAVVAIITLVGVVGSIWIARRGQKQDQVLATAEADRAERAQLASEASAERAEAAAALNIDALTRIADALEQPIVSALERSARATGELAEHAADSAIPSYSGALNVPFLQPARVKWSLRHFSGDKYILENVGDATAYNVEVSAHESLMQPREWPSAERLGPNENLTFMAVRTLGTSDATIAVSWTPTEDPEEPGVWRYPLPPRPPR
jgi:hypothetical protein